MEYDGASISLFPEEIPSHSDSNRHTKSQICVKPAAKPSAQHFSDS